MCDPFPQFLQPCLLELLFKILDGGENDYFPLVRLVKNTFVPSVFLKKQH